MSWIKENKFLAGLLGGSLLGLIALYFAGSAGVSKYDEARERFEATAAQASNFEQGPLYPTTENSNAKSKALDEYKEAAQNLQEVFKPFRPGKVDNISPQEFSNKLLAVNSEVRKAFEEAGVTVPETFFSGFEAYRTTPAAGNATGILSQQLEVVREMMLSLAKSGINELKNVHRPQLAEERGAAAQTGPAAVARALPLELTFRGPERAVREFISGISRTDQRFIVIRTLRVSSTRKEPPRTSDAKFEAPRATTPAAGGLGDIFGGGFVLPGDDDADDDDSEEGDGSEPGDEADEAPAAPPPPPAPAADAGSRILAQVLGNEEVQVFLRLDVLQFLPAKKLP